MSGTQDDDDMKKWNVPSAVAFVATIAASIALFALGHEDYGAIVLLSTLGIALPTPLRQDK